MTTTTSSKSADIMRCYPSQIFPFHSTLSPAFLSLSHINFIFALLVRDRDLARSCRGLAPHFQLFIRSLQEASSTMANNPEDSSRLLGTNPKLVGDEPKPNVRPLKKAEPSCPPPPPPEQPHVAESYAWTADGLSLSVVGQPIIGRAPWGSGLCSCLGRNDEFCSSDIEVCLLGTVAPCVLYGSNVERLIGVRGSFSYHCMTYTVLYLLGNTFFGWNCLAPWFSYRSRTAVRRRFNLEGSCEILAGPYGCCRNCLEDEKQREQCETACDFAAHVFCHPCSLCQEGREIRRRLPHPSFNAQPALFMIPPQEQTMGHNQL